MNVFILHRQLIIYMTNTQRGMSRPKILTKDFEGKMASKYALWRQLKATILWYPNTSLTSMSPYRTSWHKLCDGVNIIHRLFDVVKWMISSSKELGLAFSGIFYLYILTNYCNLLNMAICSHMSKTLLEMRCIHWWDAYTLIYILDLAKKAIFLE